MVTQSTVEQLLLHLAQLGVDLWVEAGRLRSRSDEGVITPALREQIRLNRDEIIAVLQRATTYSNIAPIGCLPRPEKLPLSFAQQRLWILAELGNSTAYNMPTILEIVGKLDLATLQQTLDEIVRRHESLRTVFASEEGTPYQVIQPPTPFVLPLIDLRSLPGTAQQAEVQRLSQLEVLQPFDLKHDLMLRGQILQLAEEHFILLLTMHHIASDGWSIGVLVREWNDLYAAFSQGHPSPLPELSIQYADYALWQREWLQGEGLNAQLTFWRKHLADAPALLELPTDQPRPAVQSYRGAAQSFLLDPKLSEALNRLSAQAGVTLFMTLLAAFKVLLYRYSGQTDLVVGTPIANRTHVEVEPLIGMFINTLALRSQLDAEDSFATLLAQVRETLQAAYDHQDLPFEMVVEALHPERSLSHAPLFQVMFALQNNQQAEITLPGLTLRPRTPAVDTTKFDLTLSLSETPEGLLGWWEYNTDLFDAATIKRMTGHFQTLLNSIVANPTQPLRELPLLTSAERHQLLVEWNDTQVDYPKDRCIHQLFEAQVERTPDAVAVVSPQSAVRSHQSQVSSHKSAVTNPTTSDSGLLTSDSGLLTSDSLTYSELNARANQLAHHLQGLGVGPDVLVGICVERSIEMVVGLLAILKAGGAYVPLDPSYPAERLAFMLQDAHPPVLLTQAHLLSQLPTTTSKVICLDQDWHEIATHSRICPLSQVQTDHLAYVIYTSGSTGKPKGAMNAHRSVVNRLLWMQDEYHLTSHDRVLQKTPFSFDVSVWEFFWPLLAGAQLVIAKPEGHKDPQYLVQTIQHQQITTLHFVPSMLRAFLEAQDVPACRSLRQVFCSGEALPSDLQHLFFAKLPIELHNLYGPTEAAVDVTYWACQPGCTRSSVPIGRPVANTQMFVLDRQLQPVPIGVAGELHIGGVQVGRGYHNRPELTQEKFIANPFATGKLYKTGDLARWLSDGNIEYLGRLDQQVKIRGFRIELGEIEAVLSQHPAVQEAVVIAREETPAEKRLVAYVVRSQESLVTSQQSGVTSQQSGVTSQQSGVTSQQSGVLTPDSGLLIAALRSHLLSKLPDYMVPSAFVLLAALPLNPNGKLDRKALPAPDYTDAQTVFVAPRNEQEALLAAIWGDVLKLARVGVNDNFFALGGDSILSIQVIAKAQQAGIQLSLQQLFQHQTIATLARQGDSAQESLPPTIAFGLLSEADRQQIPADIEDAYPLAALQAGMIFHSELNPESAVYHDIFSYQFQAPFAEDALRQAIQALAARHPTLRTRFVLTDYSEPLQLVQRSVTVPLAVVDLRDLTASEQEERLHAWLEAEKQLSFNWQQAPLFRVQIHRRSETEFDLAFSFHHAIVDGWSVASLMTELLQRYFAYFGYTFVQPAPLLASYHQFVALERTILADDSCRHYWQTALQDSSVSKLPRWSQTAPRPANAGVERLSRTLSSELSNRLQQLARQAGVPIKSVLLAAHLNVLRVLNNQTDIMTGLVSNGRPETADGERILGLFLNTLPFRLTLSGGSWLELVQQVFAHERNLLPFRRYPLAAIQQMQGGVALFETAFNFVNFHVYEGLADITGLAVVGGESFEQTNFALTANFGLDPRSEQIELDLRYDPQEFCAEQLAAILGYYETSLTAMSSDPTVNYRAVSLLSACEYQQIVHEWNDTAVDFGPPQTIHALFEQQVARTPDAVAVVSPKSQVSSHKSAVTNPTTSDSGLLTSDSGLLTSDSLTYSELNARANQLAHHLQELGVGPDVLVGICVERSIEMVVGLLAILKAGGAYVPLDPSYPAERLAFMLQDAHPPVLLTQAHLLSQLPATTSKVICLDQDWHEIATHSRICPLSQVQADHLAYVIYTSGSTGKPKGAMNAHRSVVNRLLWMQDEYHLTSHDRVLQKTPFSFDVSVWEFFWPLLAGAQLVIAKPEGHKDPQYLVQTIQHQQITTLHFVPSMLRAFLEAQDVPACRSLRQVFCSGEALPSDLQHLFFAKLPIELHNLYGPTEAAVDVTYWACQPGCTRSSVPIGRPVANTQMFVLDRQLQPVPIGVAGELHIGGVQVGRGYHNRPELTQEKFIANPFATGKLYKTGDLARWLSDGNIEYLGRLDQQVKIRGFRIELGEIEAVLSQHPAVQEAVVIAREETPAEKRLVAYVVRSQESLVTSQQSGVTSQQSGVTSQQSLVLSQQSGVLTPDLGLLIAALRSHLLSKLPDYMVPSAFVLLAALPLNPNGKLDRKALPAPDASSFATKSAYTPPSTPTEVTLAAIWSAVLGLEQVSIHDSFFELGGHSLLATQVVSRIRQSFAVELPLRQLFETPTIASLAQCIGENKLMESLQLVSDITEERENFVL